VEWGGWAGLKEWAQVSQDQILSMTVLYVPSLLVFLIVLYVHMVCSTAEELYHQVVGLFDEFCQRGCVHLNPNPETRKPNILLLYYSRA